MKITEFSVKRPVTTAMLFLALVIFGLMAYNKLSVNLMPDLNLPAMAISTYHFGATPEEVESEITEQIEKELSTISGLKMLQSFSMPHNSLIFTQFEMGVNADKALAEVKSKLDLVIPALPKEAERPLIQKYSFSDAPVLELIVSGDLPGKELYKLVDKNLKDKLSRIDGVSKIDLSGGEIREIRVLADKRNMYDIQMNLTDISGYLKLVNTKLSGGDFTNQHRQFSVETGQRFESAEDIKNTFIPTPSGNKQITDFAMVVDTIKGISSKALFFDVANQQRYSNIIGISVMKNSDANAVQVAKEVKNLLPDLQEALPEGVALSIPFDDSVYTESAVNDALMNVILGILFTGFILFFFLNDIRTTLIVSISVPVSLIGTFIAIRLFNGSLNMMTLMSYSVAIGALISNSIVVIENILRLRKEGMGIKEAAIQGTREVMMAVIASTGTNLVVFLPIASMTSITGAFFKEYALTISAATIFSLIVSFMLTPMLTSVLMKKEKKPSWLSRKINRFFHRLENAYERSLETLISRRRNPVFLFAIMFAFFITSAGLLSKIGFEFEPQEDNGNVFVELEMPAGTAIHRSTELMENMQEMVGKHSEVKSILSFLGEKNSFTNGSNFANAAIKLIPKEEREISNVEFAEILSKELENIPEIIANVSTVSSEEGAPIQFTLQSSNNEELIAANQIVDDKLAEVKGLLNYQSSFQKGNPVIHLEPKQRILSELNLTSFDIATQVRSAITGVKASILKEKGQEYDITISYPGWQINTLEKIKELPIFTPFGIFTIDQLVEVAFESSQAQILHRDKIRTIDFTANPAPNVVMGEARTQIDEAISQLDLPSSVTFQWSGNVEELDEAMDDMLLTFGIALLLMYMLLASLLENTWHPIIIFTTVPMAMIGVFVFMYFGGHTMNIMALMAIVTLLGLVVNDDILIHDYTEQLMHKGMKIKEATLMAGRTKMKTVIMTTVAIIVGMLPNAIGIGDAGAAYRTPMAIVTIGGMITSTILTLYLIPSLFYIIRAKKSEME